MEASISFRNVSYKAQNYLEFTNLNFGVEKGSVHALTGTELSELREILLLAGALKFPHRGNVFVNGAQTTRNTIPIKETTAYISEDALPVSGKTFRNICTFLTGVYNIDHAQSDAVIKELSSFFDLEKWLDCKIDQIPRNLYFILSLILNMTYDPEILLLNSPFESSPPSYHSRLEEFILDRRKIKTFIFTSNQEKLLEDLPDRITIIHRGSVLFNGSYIQLKEVLGQQNVLTIRLKENASGYQSIIREHFPDYKIIKKKNTLRIYANSSINYRDILSHLETSDIIDFSTNSLSLAQIIRRLTVEYE